MINACLISISLVLFFFFSWFSLVSIIEKEPLAFKRSLLLAIILPLPFILLFASSFQFKELLSLILFGLIVLSIFALLIPINFSKNTGCENPQSQIDERNTMFSRRELTNKTEKFESYYKNNPEYLAIDNDWRKKPGLMSEKSSMYSPLAFTAADASFFTIESLRNQVTGDVNTTKKNFSNIEYTQFIKKWSKKLGAINMGVCELQKHHLYSYRGRGKEYGNKVENNHKYAIAFTVEMDKDFLATGPAGPTLMESAQQYLNSGIIAIQVAKFIRELGYEACAHIDGDYEVVCPLVARDAGLGEIGRMGLLMTPKLGPRIRIAVVTTNLPLLINKRKPDYTVQSFCAICKKCANVCPSQAISKNNKIEIEGINRWQINQEKCFSYWCTSGTDCGRCMSVCPYSHPNNLLHNMVRWGIKNSVIFRHFALFMDDFFYGRKPKPAKIPAWLNIFPK
ncbi:MAG: reductive dehalogenase [Salinivirgaceae bacterium]|nr:reductive dehalogenase [Salinivirgaceae bacterium]